jgi:serine/threonine-protein kinase
MASNGLLSGRTIGDKYVLGALLGEGGFGEVYKAANGPYAVKLLLREYCGDEKAVRRFVEEARWLARLNHPNIIKIHALDIDKDKNRIYMEMPYIDGTLDYQLKKKGSLGLNRTKKYLKQICAALDHLHEQGGVHLDIKPSNILCNRDKVLFLSDFGLAHLIGQVDGKTGLVRLDQSKAKTSMRMGTIHYMAPERLAWRPEKRSDIYSGCRQKVRAQG